MTPPRLSVSGLDVVLPGGRKAVRGVDLDLSSPGLTVLLGPNGAGKSSLLKAMGHIIRPSAGIVRLDGQDIAVLSVPDRARRIGYLPQDRTIHWSLSVRSLVALGRRPYRTSRHGNATDDPAVTGALAALDVSHLADRNVLQLSGGEQARVLMARVLAQEPSLILADEPSAGLDPGHQWALFERLSSLAKTGPRVVVALHDLMLASRFARHVVLITEGRIVASGGAADVMTDTCLADVFGIAAERVESGGQSLVVPSGLARAT